MTSRTKKLTLAVVLGVPVLALLVIWLSLDLDSILEAQRDRLVPVVERTLGRKVTVGRISTSLFPTVTGEVHGIEILGRDGSRPWVTIDEIRVGIDLWRAITSLGSDLRVDEVAVRGLRVELRREPNGVMNHQDVLDRLTSGEAGAEEGEPFDPGTLQGLRVSRVALEDATIHVVDEATGGKPFDGTVSRLNVELTDIALGRPVGFLLTARVFSPKDNLRMEATTTALDLAHPDRMGLDRFTISAKGVDLGRLAPYLGPSVPIEAVVLTADLSAKGLSMSEGAKARISGLIEAEGLRFPGGEGFDLRVEQSVGLSDGGSEISIDEFHVTMAGMGMSLKGKIHHALTKPTFDGLVLDVPGLELGKVQACLPQLRLPAGAKLAGPLGVHAEASGDRDSQVMSLALSLTDALVSMPGAIHKPPKVPLELRFEGGIRGDSVQVRELGITLGPMAIRGRGTLGPGSKADLEISSKPFPIDGLVKLLPAVAEATPAGVTYQGVGSFEAKVEGGANHLVARLHTGFTAAKVSVPGLELGGSWSLDVSGEGSPSDLTGTATLDLTPATLMVPGRVDKPAGVPVRLSAEVHLQDRDVRIERSELVLGPLVATLSGRVSGGGGLGLELRVPRFDLGNLGRMVPALGEALPKGGSLELTAGVTGTTSNPKVTLKKLSFASGRTRVDMTARLDSVSPVVASFDLRSSMLDLDELLPRSRGREEADGSSGGLPVLPKDLKLDGSVEVVQGRAGGVRFGGLAAALGVSKGVVYLRRGSVRVFGGRVTLSGTRLDLGTSEPSMDLKVEVSKVRAEQLLAATTSMGKVVSGAASLHLTASGRGGTWERLSKNLGGDLEVELTDGRLYTMNLLGGAVGSLLEHLPRALASAGGLPTNPREGTRFRRLAGRFSIQDGRMELTEPMRVQTPNGQIKLDGAIGLDQSLELDGTYFLTPKTIQTLTLGRFEPSRSLPVVLAIRGTLTSPKVEGVRVEDTAREIAKGYLESQVGARVDEIKAEAERRAREAAARAEEEARRAAKKAEEQARRRAEQARRRAEQAARKAKERARKKAQEAKKKAADKARKAIEGLF